MNVGEKPSDWDGEVVDKHLFSIDRHLAILPDVLLRDRPSISDLIFGFEFELREQWRRKHVLSHSGPGRLRQRVGLGVLVAK